MKKHGSIIVSTCDLNNCCKFEPYCSCVERIIPTKTEKCTNNFLYLSLSLTFKLISELYNLVYDYVNKTRLIMKVSVSLQALLHLSCSLGDLHFELFQLLDPSTCRGRNPRGGSTLSFFHNTTPLKSEQPVLLGTRIRYGSSFHPSRRASHYPHLIIILCIIVYIFDYSL